jgi:NADPH:quinone reductase-like Zn-dependent oxidoreductase
MKAVVYERYGSPDVLRYADVQPPRAGAGEVLVRVRTASVNRGDIFALYGVPRLIRVAFGLRRPRRTILGRAVAGTVEAVGPGVTRLRVGDEVLGEVAQRGFAEYVAAGEREFARIPVGVSFEQAATLPVAGTTAVQAIRAADVQAGQSVLINGASGGVGTFCVQLAKVARADVTAACGPRNAEVIRSLGADHVVDYTREDVTRHASQFDAIIDLVGDRPLRDLRRALVPRGVFIASSGYGGTVLGPIPRLLAVAAAGPVARQRLRPLAARNSVEDLTTLATLVAEGKVSPVIERTYPMAETADAIRYIESQRPAGKVVLTAL